MPEGLSAAEVGNEARRHREEFEHDEAAQSDAHDVGASAPEHGSSHRKHRGVFIAEAVLLALVTIVTAWAGYAAAKWSTESRVQLAKAATLRAQASRDDLEAMELRNFDSSTFQTWFTAYVQNNPSAEAVAIRRFRPEFKVAFDAWRATNPDTNPNAPPGPTYMPEYKQPQKDQADALDHTADETFASGETAGGYADDYVRITVILAAVLFLIGIGSTFQLFGARYALVAVGLALLVFALVLILQRPAPPS
jgi:hypothetical protein